MTLPLTHPELPRIAVCRGTNAAARNIRMGESFWIRVDGTAVRRRFATFLLALVLTGDLLPVPFLALAQEISAEGEASKEAAVETEEVEPLDRIAGIVFADRNGNGVREENEEGIQGVSVKLTRDGETLLLQTDEQGRYTFEGTSLTAETLSETGDAAALLFLDIDKDRDGDLFVGNASSLPNRLYRNIEGKLENAGVMLEEHPDGPFSSARAMALLDTTGGGLEDIIVGGAEGIELYENQGGGTFTLRKSAFLMPPEAGSATGSTVPLVQTLTVLDLDGDRRKDIFVGRGFGLPNVLFRNEGKGTFSYAGEWMNGGIAGTTPGATNAVLLFDLDGDKDEDVILGNEGGNELYVQEDSKNVSCRVTSRVSSLDTRDDTAGCIEAPDSSAFHFAGYRFNGGFTGSTVRPTHAIAAFDADGDGDEDLLFGKEGGNELYWNEGGGEFTLVGDIFAESSRVMVSGDEPLHGESPFVSAQGDTRTITVFDVDADGDSDLFLGSAVGRSALYLNDSLDGAIKFRRLEMESHAESSLSVDLDGDDDFDLLVGGGIGEQGALHRNRTGAYSIVLDEESIPSGFASSSKGSLIGELSIGSVKEGQDIALLPEGLLHAGSLQGRVFLDHNADGKDDPTERGLAGVTVHLTGKSSEGEEFTASAVTDAEGQYNFQRVPVSAVPYELLVDTVTLPVSYSATTDLRQQALIEEDDQEVLASGMGFQDLRETLGSGTIRGKASVLPLDDGEGVRGMAGVRVTLSGSLASTSQATGARSLTFETMTGEDGSYSFESIPRLKYEMRVDETSIPEGLLPVESLVRFIEFTEEIQEQSFDFTREAAIVAVRVTRETTHAPIAGVALKLLEGGRTLSEKHTDLSGTARFFVRPGSFAISLSHDSLPAGYTVSSALTQNVFVAATGDHRDVEFSASWNEECGTGLCVLGTVWHDSDGDGVRGAGEEGIPEVSVEMRRGDDTLAGAESKHLALATTDASGSYVLSTSAFQEVPSTFESISDAGPVSAIGVMDVNNDGLQDLIVGKYGERNEVFVQEKETKDSKNVSCRVTSGVSLDTRDDAAGCIEASESFSFRSLGSRFNNGFLGSDARYTTSIETFDIDGDNDDDVLIGNDAQPNELYRNLGNGQFELLPEDFTPNDMPEGVGRHTAGFLIANLTGDFHDDVLVLNTLKSPNELYEGRGNGTFRYTGEFFNGGLSAEHRSSVAAVTLDSDGNGDFDHIVIGNDLQEPNELYELNAEGEIRYLGDTFNGGIADAEDRSTVALTALDVDRDGDDDLLVGNSDRPNELYENHGNGNFTYVGEHFNDHRGTGARTKDFVLFDADGDNDEDVLVVSENAPVALYRSEGNGSFTWVGNVFEDSPSLLLSTDLDRDGKRELVLGYGNAPHPRPLPSGEGNARCCAVMEPSRKNVDETFTISLDQSQLTSAAQFTTPTTYNLQPITYNLAEGIDFGLTAETGSIEGTVFEDRNGNGIRDVFDEEERGASTRTSVSSRVVPSSSRDVSRDNTGAAQHDVLSSESALPGALLTLEGVSIFGQGIVRETVTDAEGRYSFENVPPAQGEGYILRAEVAGQNAPHPDPLFPTTPAYRTIPLLTGGLIIARDFSFAEGVRVEGRVGVMGEERGASTSANVSSRVIPSSSRDVSRDNIGAAPTFAKASAGRQHDVKDSSGLPGIQLSLDGATVTGDPLSRSVRTDADGQFVFDSLPFPRGTYTLRIVLDSVSEDLTAVAETSVSLEAHQGGETIEHSFSFVRSSRIEGRARMIKETSLDTPGAGVMPSDADERSEEALYRGTEPAPGTRDDTTIPNPGITLTLSGETITGERVNRTLTTDTLFGTYAFIRLLPGEYAIAIDPASVPEGYRVEIDGSTGLTTSEEMRIRIGSGVTERRNLAVLKETKETEEQPSSVSSGTGATGTGKVAEQGEELRLLLDEVPVPTAIGSEVVPSLPEISAVEAAAFSQSTHPTFTFTLSEGVTDLAEFAKHLKVVLRDSAGDTIEPEYLLEVVSAPQTLTGAVVPAAPVSVIDDRTRQSENGERQIEHEIGNVKRHDEELQKTTLIVQQTTATSKPEMTNRASNRPAINGTTSPASATWPMSAKISAIFRSWLSVSRIADHFITLFSLLQPGRVHAQVSEGTSQTSLVITIVPPADFAPGAYTIEVSMAAEEVDQSMISKILSFFGAGTSKPENQQTILLSSEFSWGVFAFNPDQDRYVAGDAADLAFGVLDDHGEMVCGAEIDVRVRHQRSEVRDQKSDDTDLLSLATDHLSTRDGSIAVSPTCTIKEPGLITPDYSAKLKLRESGTYKLAITVTTPNGVREYEEEIVVIKNDAPLDTPGRVSGTRGDTMPILVHRLGATRLWPLAPSPMTITVSFFEDYTGPVTEYVPASFVITKAEPAEISNHKSQISNNSQLFPQGPSAILNSQLSAPPTIDRQTLNDREVIAITWEGSWKAGESGVFAYEYDAPDKSPDFFLLGPLKLGSAEARDHPAVMEMLENAREAPLDIPLDVIPSDAASESEQHRIEGRGDTPQLLLMEKEKDEDTGEETLVPRMIEKSLDTSSVIPSSPAPRASIQRSLSLASLGMTQGAGRIEGRDDTNTPAGTSLMLVPSALQIVNDKHRLNHNNKNSAGNLEARHEFVETNVTQRHGSMPRVMLPITSLQIVNDEREENGDRKEHRTNGAIVDSLLEIHSEGYSRISSARSDKYENRIPAANLPVNKNTLSAVAEAAKRATATFVQRADTTRSLGLVRSMVHDLTAPFGHLQAPKAHAASFAQRATAARQESDVIPPAGRSLGEGWSSPAPRASIQRSLSLASLGMTQGAGHIEGQKPTVKSHQPAVTELRQWQIANDVSGTVRTWDGGGGPSDINWSTASNWSGDSVPTSNEIVVFNGAAGKTNATVNSSFAGKVHELRVGTSFTGTITLARTLTVSGALVLSGGTLDVSASNYDLTVKGDWIQRGSGAFNARSGTVILSGTGSAGHPNGTNTLSGSSTFNNLTIDNGLVGYWRLDDGTGATIARDSSRRGNNGTYSGGPVWVASPSHTSRFFNPYSLKFDGTDDYVDIGSLNNGTVHTVAFWMDYRDSGDGVVIGGADNIYACYIDGPNSSTHTINYAQNGSVGVVHGGFTSGTWYHIVIVRNGTSVSFYKNGIQIGATQTLAANNAQTLKYFGQEDAPGTFPFTGLLDDIRIYNRALTLGEVQSLNNGYQSTGSGVYVLGNSLNVAGNIRIDAGTLDASSSNYAITLSGAWINHGDFTQRSGTVTLDGGTAAQTLSGNTVFNNLTRTVTSAATTFFDFTARQSVSGALTLRGNTATHSLRSTKTGSAANLLLDGSAGTQSLQLLDVRDSDASGGATLACTTGCTNTANNTNWTFGTQKVWDGGGSGTNWSTAANWSGDTVPTSNDIAIFDGTGKKNAIVNPSFAGIVAGLRITAAHTGSLTLNRNLTVSGAVALSGGTLTFSDQGRTMTVKGNWDQRPGNTFTAGTGTVILSGTGSSGHWNGTNTLSGSATFNNLTIDNGLVGYWRLDDGTGATIARDSSRQGNNGTFSGGPIWVASPSHTSRFFNPYALSFDGTDDYVRVGDNFPISGNAMSISFWIYLIGHDAWATPVSKSSSSTQSTANHDWSVSFSGTADTIYLIRNGSNRNESNISIPRNKWSHFAGIITETESRMYFDGVASTAQGGIGTGNTQNTAGRNFDIMESTWGDQVNGLIDDVRIYNRALSLGEIQSLNNGYQSTGSGVYVLGNSLNVAGNLRIDAGTLDASSSNYSVTLSGAWINHGDFTQRSGTVTLDGGTAAQTLSGNTVFNNLTRTVTSAATTFFDFTARQSVSGALTLRGAASNLQSLRSTKTGSAANLLLDGSAGTQTIDYLNVRDSDASGGQALLCFTNIEGCTDSGGNTNWIFHRFTGKVFSDAGTTSIGANKVVSMSLNGGAVTDSGPTDAGGQFTLSGATLTGGTIVTLFLDGETEDAVTVTLGSGSNMTGVSLYQNRLIARSDSGSVSLTNAHLATADNSGDSDIASMYTVDSSVLNVKSGKNLFVWASDTFTPGANVNAGSGVTIQGTYSAGSTTLTLSGNFLKTSAGTFTAGTSTVALDGGTQTVSGATTFYNLSKTVTAAATLTLAATATQTISNALTLQGAAANLLTIRSSLSGIHAKIDPQGTRSVSYVSVSYNNNVNATAVDCSSNCTDGGNNVNWSFPAASSSSGDGGHHKPNKFPNDGKKGGGQGQGQGGQRGQEGGAEGGEPMAWAPLEEQPSLAADIPGPREDEDGIHVPMRVLSSLDRERLARERRLARGAEAQPSVAAGGEVIEGGEVGEGSGVAQRKILEGLRRLRRLAPGIAPHPGSLPSGEGMRTVIPPFGVAQDLRPGSAAAPGEGGEQAGSIVHRMRVFLLSLLRDMPFGPVKIAGQASEKLARSLAALPAMKRGDRLIAGLGRDLRSLMGAERKHFTAPDFAQRASPGRPASERYYTTRLRQGEAQELILETFRIAIIGPRGPYAFIPVTLSSEPQNTVTNREGIATFQDVATGKHELTIHLGKNEVLEKEVTLEEPEGLEVAEDAPVEVIIPLVEVRVSDPPAFALGATAGKHGAALPQLRRELFTRTVIIITLAGALLVQTCLLILVLRRKRKGQG